MSSMFTPITAVALNTPLGNDLKEVLELWRCQHDRFEIMKTSSTVESPVRYAGYCSRINTELFPDRKIQKALTRKDVLGITTAIQAFRNANIEPTLLAPERLGVFVGSPSTQLGELTPYLSLISKCIDSTDLKGGQPKIDAKLFGELLTSEVNPMVMLQTLMNNTLCYTSSILNARGPNGNYVDLHTSSIRALAEAKAAIDADRCDVAIVGAISAQPEPYFSTHAVAMEYLADTADISAGEISKIVRPFDQQRKGTILSEGAVFLILESPKFSAQRKQEPLAYLQDVSLNTGKIFRSNRLIVGDDNGLSDLLSKITNENNIQTNVEAVLLMQANGTKYFDQCAAIAIKKSFPTQYESLPVHSSCASFGDLSEAHGMLNVVLAIDALKNQSLPPTKNYTSGDECTGGLHLIGSEAFNRSNAIVCSQSFSGANGVVLLRRS